MRHSLAVGFFKPVIRYDDWFLPSKDELNEMWEELYSYGVGNFSSGIWYWSSSESSATQAWTQSMFESLIQGAADKDTPRRIRACRSFTSVSISYNLRDRGPANGYIFWKSGNNYLEAAPSDMHSELIYTFSWSNIIADAIGTTGVVVGTGQANTTAIIGQLGHTTSAAKQCNDLIILN